MYKLMEEFFNKSFALWVIALMIFLFLLLEPVIGLGEGFMRSKHVKIDGKTYNTIIVKERHFQVTSGTKFFNLIGKRIELYDLPIPCEAKIKYLLKMDQGPILLGLTIEKTYPHATPVWDAQEHR